jgi:hypothetical protein
MGTVTSTIYEHPLVSICTDSRASEQDLPLPNSSLPRHLFCNLLLESTWRILASLGETYEYQTRSFVQCGAEWKSLKCFMPEFIGFTESHLHFRSFGPHAKELNEQIQSVLRSLASMGFDSDGYIT